MVYSKENQRFLARSFLLEFVIDFVNHFAFYVAFMGSEASSEAPWDVHEFVDKRFLFVFCRHLIIDFRNDLYGIGWRHVQNPLPKLAQAVNSCDSTFGFAALAPDTINELWNYMEKFAFCCELVNLLFNFGRFVVLYGHSNFP